jgi:hypothetical protein
MLARRAPAPARPPPGGAEVDDYAQDAGAGHTGFEGAAAGPSHALAEATAWLAKVRRQMARHEAKHARGALACPGCGFHLRRLDRAEDRVAAERRHELRELDTR